MSEQGFRGIQGVPEGWELVRIVERPQIGEYALDRVNHPVMVMEPDAWDFGVIIRKIETPKRYRPFASAEEFKPHRDRWWKSKKDDSTCFPPATYGDNLHCGLNWEESFENKLFDDGSPFGVECEE
jgi:hypothetical protein